MYEDEEYRNYYSEEDDYDEDFDGRNARFPFFGRSRSRGRSRGRFGRPIVRPTIMRPVQTTPAPWRPKPASPPIVNKYTGNVKVGLVIDAAAQVLASMASLPSAPVATGEAKADTGNLVKYQGALAQHAKRDEQIRTVGALARLFLV